MFLEKSKYELILFLILIFFLILFSLYLGNWSFTTFCNFGQQTLSDEFPLQTVIFKDSIGYDGQYYCRIAIEPFNISKEALGVSFESPSYRYSRIIYPLFAWVFSFGVPAISIFNLIFINLISLFFIYILGKKYFKFDYFIFFLPFIPFVISRNTAEIFSIFFIILSIIAVEKRRLLFFSISSSLAILTRETSLIFYSTAIFFFLINNKIKLVDLLILSLPAIFFIFWRLFLLKTFGDLPENIGTKVNFNLNEFSLFSSYFNFLFRLNDIKYLIHFIQLTIILLFVTFVLFNIKFKKLGYVEVSFLIYLIFFNFLASHIYSSDFAFFRVLPEMFLLGFIIMYKNNNLPNIFFKFNLIFLFILNIIRITYNHYLYLI